MQFEDNDEFDGIVAVIRNNLQGLSGVLHVSGVVRNALDYLLPVQNLDDFHRVREILESMSAAGPSSKDGHMDFIWVSLLSALRGCGYCLQLIGI